MNIVKQTELASLSLGQCLTPWLYFTCNPEILETQTPVNHPPQVFTISKPKLYHSFQQLALICFLQLDTLHSFIVSCKIALKMCFKEACCGRWNWADSVSPPLCWWGLVVLGLHTFCLWRLDVTDQDFIFFVCLVILHSPDILFSNHESLFSSVWIMSAGCVQMSGRQLLLDITYIKVCRTIYWTWNLYLFTHKSG